MRHYKRHSVAHAPLPRLMPPHLSPQILLNVHQTRQQPTHGGQPIGWRGAVCGEPLDLDAGALLGVCHTRSALSATASALRPQLAQALALGGLVCSARGEALTPLGDAYHSSAPSMATV